MLIIGLPFCALTTNKARGGARYFLYYTLARSNRLDVFSAAAPPPFSNARHAADNIYIHTAADLCLPRSVRAAIN
jgi:hypothetical protein